MRKKCRHRGKYYTKHNGPGEGVEECDKKRVEEKIVQGERKKGKIA